MPGSAGERRDRGRRRARAWCTPAWRAPGRPRRGPAAARALALIDAPPPAYLVGDGPLRGALTRLIRARGLEAVVHLPGWSHEPARDIAQATVHVVPSREESWSQSAVLALGLGVPVDGTAVDGLARTLGKGRGVPVPPEDPRALAGKLSRVLAGERPRPRPRPGLRLAVHPQRSGRGIGQRLPPAARQPRQSRGSQARHGLETSAFWCRSWSWAAVLTEMTAPTGRQVTALPHSSERTAEPAETSASSRDDGRSARLPLVTARDGSSVRKGADPPSSCSSGCCHRSLAVAAQIGRYLSCLRTSAWPAAAGLVPGWSGRPSEC
jgi:GNAT superfamily N-acetyltransferase